MTDRDRLAVKICNATQKTNFACKEAKCVEKRLCAYCYVMADDLLANGVIVPPCKVGETIYYHFQFSNKRILPFTRKAKVKKTYCTNNKWDFVVDVELIDAKEKGIMKSFHFSDFGKTVFLTKEEAEKALKEGADNG